MKRKYGLAEAAWGAIKVEIREILVEVASGRGTITYGGLTARLETAQLAPRSYALARLLRDVCHAEETAGRGMLCALVVRKADGLPGNGFFKTAAEMGHDVQDIEAFWTAEVERLYAIWSK